jgi:hypothetical protein
MACRERISFFLRRLGVAPVSRLTEMPGRGLEPLRISPPDPKSGASANSATPACLIIKDLQMPLSTKDAFVLEFVIELRCERRCNANKSRIAQVDIAPPVTRADSTKDRAQFIAARDSRNRRIPGLYLRGDRYYAQLWVDVGNGKKTSRRFPLRDGNNQLVRTLSAARANWR